MSFELIQRLVEAPEDYEPPKRGDTAKIADLLLNAGVCLDQTTLPGCASQNALYGSITRMRRDGSQLKVVKGNLILPDFEEEMHFLGARFLDIYLPEKALVLDEEHKKCIGENQNPGNTTVGWWALGEDIIWTRRQETAENIREVFSA